MLGRLFNWRQITGNGDRLLLLIVWALATGYAVIGGTEPGFRSLDSGFDYPWWPVVRASLLVALECLLQYMILRTNRIPSRSRRAFVAAGLSFLLFVYETLFMWTDRPGWVYTNWAFAGIATIALVAYAFGLRAKAGSPGPFAERGNAV